MIERNLQNLTIRKYGTAFLEAFGMLPLTYFGAVGDNMSDNYANIQVAIDESIKRGLKYIFVPNGTYYYAGNLLNVEQVIFIGNEKYAKIYNEEGEIKIYQIGTYVAPEYLKQGLTYTAGNQTLNMEVAEDGEIEIETNVLNGSEAVIVVDEEVFKVEGGIITRNGKLFAGVPMSSPQPGVEPDYCYIGENVYLTFIEISENVIKLRYRIKETTGTIDTRVYWRVR